MSFLKSFLKTIFNTKGHIPNSTIGHLIISNHTSFLDGPILYALSDDNTYFVVWEKFAKLARIFTPNIIAASFNSPHGIKEMIKHLKNGKNVVIFPEGRISTTGNLMKIYPGIALVIQKTGAKIVPMHIQGVEFSYFSRLSGKRPRKLFPKIVVGIFPAKEINHSNKEIIIQRIYDSLQEAYFFTRFKEQNIWHALKNAKNIFGSRVIAEDPGGKLSYATLIRKSLCLANALNLGHNQTIGVLLPTSNAALLTFLALLTKSNVAAFLNFTQNIASIKYCLELAKIETIITSRKFAERLSDVFGELSDYKIIYLEDLKIGFWSILQSFVRKPVLQHPDKTAVILFTSGSEGTPKAVPLTHNNLLANFIQVQSVLDFTDQDLLLNILPVFHSFGFMIGTLLPLMVGVKTYLYPSPLHYRVIGNLVYDLNATIFFATDTLLQKYAKHSHEYDFHSLRYVFAGAEKLQEKTHQIWLNKLGINVLQGYGTTEASPVLALNTALYKKPNSIGKLLPAIEYKLQEVPGMQGGELLVRGPNIIQGYLGQEEFTDYYATGDIVEINEYGFLKILGRRKRFAKIAGEMISLPMVEEAIQKFFSDENQYAVISLADETRGESLILFTTNKNITSLRGVPLEKLAIPKKIIYLKALPLLGSGKIDYQGLLAHFQQTP